VGVTGFCLYPPAGPCYFNPNLEEITIFSFVFFKSSYQWRRNWNTKIVRFPHFFKHGIDGKGIITKSFSNFRFLSLCGTLNLWPSSIFFDCEYLTGLNSVFGKKKKKIEKILVIIPSPSISILKKKMRKSQNFLYKFITLCRIQTPNIPADGGADKTENRL
jgi:hypothetical protein